MIQALLRPALSLSKNGSSIHSNPAMLQPRMPSTSPSTNQINVSTYSPVLKQFKTASSSQFTLSYDM